MLLSWLSQRCTTLSLPHLSPAGWRGFNCIHPAKRFCTHTYRQWGFEPQRMPPNLPNTGADPNSMPYSRCAAGGLGWASHCFFVWLTACLVRRAGTAAGHDS